MKSNFYKDRLKKVGFCPECEFCCKKYCNNLYYNSQNRILNSHKNFNKKNRSKINAYERRKRKTGFNFKLVTKEEGLVKHSNLKILRKLIKQLI